VQRHRGTKAQSKCHFFVILNTKCHFEYPKGYFFQYPFMPLRVLVGYKLREKSSKDPAKPGPFEMTRFFSEA